MNNDYNFLRDFVELSKGTEIPEEFMLWCGISGISAALSRRVFIDMNTFLIYPNMYIILLAGSGRCRKSTAIKQVDRLLRALEPKPNLISQRITPEGLIEALKIKDEKGELRASEGFVIVDELSTFINRKSYEAGLASLLISLFDCVDNFEYRTKGGGIDQIKFSCLGLLGASTIDWIKNAIPFDAVGGGLTSRMIFVYVENPPPPVAFPSWDSSKQLLAEQCLRSLTKFSALSGEFKLSDEAKDFYTYNYNTFYKESPLFESATLSGYASRRFVHFLKLGIIFCVARGLKVGLVIELQDLKAAERCLKIIEPSLERVLSLITSSEKGTICERIYFKIRKVKAIKREELLRLFSNRVDAMEFENHITTLVRAGRIEVKADGGSVVYVLKG